MGRKPRIEYKGAVYHVIQRGNNREYIFKDKEYKSRLLNLTREYKDIMNFDLYGYVLMDNHYHMIIKTLDTPLQDIMHRINNRYSKFYNFLKSRTGHVFENRYKSILVKDDKYLLSLLRYVHQNPIKAQMCQKVKDYKWSSDSFYRINKREELVDIDFILDIFSENRTKAIKEYHNFMDDKELEESSVFEEVKIIGDKKYKKEEVKKTNQKDSRKSLDDILKEVTREESIYTLIKNRSRKRILTTYKQEYISKALKANYTMKEIAKNITVSEAAIFKLHEKNHNKEW